MIVVVEGPSAAGKTTWAIRWGSERLVEELPHVEPPVASDLVDVARFWMTVSCARWTRALAVEQAHGIVVCDSDPLKLHYDYCLARVGVGGWDQFVTGVAVAREAIERRELGIADVVVCHIPDDAELDRNRRSDATRERRNFELHRRLGLPLRDWYHRLDELDPGRVVWSFDGDLPRRRTALRYDLDLFDEWMRSLPR